MEQRWVRPIGRRIPQDALRLVSLDEFYLYREAHEFGRSLEAWLDQGRKAAIACWQTPIKRFLGTSENAVKTQIWCAVSTYVLIAIVKKELHLDASLYTCLQILSVSVFEKTEASCALQPDRSQPESPNSANQLILFDF